MKVLWVSPDQAGAVTAQRLQAGGHTVVSWPSEIAGIPVISRSALTAFATAADLVVVDGPFGLERTSRSWRPAMASLFFDELRRKHRVTAIGPTPTVDLLCGDARYFRKWCQRLKIPYTRELENPWTAGGWFHGHEVLPTGPYLEAWKPLFKSVGFRGWFELVGVGEALTGCDARWNPQSIPEGREREFLMEMTT